MTDFASVRLSLRLLHSWVSQPDQQSHPEAVRRIAASPPGRSSDYSTSRVTVPVAVVVPEVPVTVIV